MYYTASGIITPVGGRPVHSPLSTCAPDGHLQPPIQYRGADKSLARPGRKHSNVSVRMARISVGALPRREIKLDDSSRLDVVEITCVPDMLPSLFPSWPG